MNRDAVIAALRAHEAELKAAGLVRLSLFGSTARDAAGPESDIDLLAAFDEVRPLSLLDVIRIENQLADLLGQPVDLIEEGTLKPRVRQNVDREAVRAL
jgi:predicted nucleotidyltransferase